MTLNELPSQSWQLKRGAIGSINMAGSGNNSLQIVLETSRKDALGLTSRAPLLDCAPERKHVAEYGAVRLTDEADVSELLLWPVGTLSTGSSASVAHAFLNHLITMLMRTWIAPMTARSPPGTRPK